jgi:hypothetical protein
MAGQNLTKQKEILQESFADHRRLSWLRTPIEDWQ